MNTAASENNINPMHKQVLLMPPEKENNRDSGFEGEMGGVKRNTSSSNSDSNALVPVSSSPVQPPSLLSGDIDIDTWRFFILTLFNRFISSWVDLSYFILEFVCRRLWSIDLRLVSGRSPSISSEKYVTLIFLVEP